MGFLNVIFSSKAKPELKTQSFLHPSLTFTHQTIFIPNTILIAFVQPNSYTVLRIQDTIQLYIKYKFVIF